MSRGASRVHVQKPGQKYSLLHGAHARTSGHLLLPFPPKIYRIFEGSHSAKQQGVGRKDPQGSSTFGR